MGTNSLSNGKTYLDEAGNPIKVYLDENGNPQTQSDTLSPDVEALRQRNLQSGLEQSASPVKRKLQYIASPFQSAGNAIVEGAKQIPTSHALAGLENIGSGLLESFPAALSSMANAGKIVSMENPALAPELLPPIAGFELGGKALGWLTNKIVEPNLPGNNEVRPLGYLTPPFMKFKVPESATPEYKATQRLAQNVAGYALAEAGTKLSSSIRESIAPTLEARNTLNADQPFIKGIERTSTRGGIRGQVEDINIVRADLSKAYSSGLEKNPNKFISQKLQEPLEQAKADLFQQELAVAEKHPNDQVYLGGKNLDKLKTPQLKRSDPSAFSTIDQLKARYDQNVNPAQALNDLAQLNDEISAYYRAVESNKEAPPFSSKELIFRKTLADALRKNYLATMENVGEPGIRQSRLRYGALDNLITDIVVNKNKLDKLPQGFFERAVQTTGTSLSGRILDNLFYALRKTPADYAIKSAQRWAELGLKPEQLRGVGGLLPQRGTIRDVNQIPNPNPATMTDAIRTPMQVNFGSGQKALPPFNPFIRSPYGSVDQIPNPNVRQPQYYAPESFIRGTGKEGLDINKWQDATSANPENVQWAMPEWINDYRNPPLEPLNPVSPEGVKNLYPNFKSVAEKGTTNVLPHRELVESYGLKYMGTDSRGNIYFDNHGQSTGMIPKGSTPQEIAEIVRKTKSKTY